MNFLKRLFGGGAAKEVAVSDSAQPNKPMAAPRKPDTPSPAGNAPPDDMTLIDPVAKDAWKAEQWRAQTRPGGYDKKK